MKALLLAPKNARGGGALPDYRQQLAARLAEQGHCATTLEAEPDKRGEALRTKFLRVAATCQQAVLVWPQDAAMATTADEIILLQEAYESRPFDIVLILHAAEVTARGHELHVHAPADQSRYLDGILACQPFMLLWPKDASFDAIVDRYSEAFL